MTDKIIRLCKEQGKSISDIEHDCGIGARTIYRWDAHIPAIDKVKRVADYLNVSIDELMKEDT